MVTIDVTPGNDSPAPELDDLNKKELWVQVCHQANRPPAYSTLCRWLDKDHMNMADSPYSHKHVYLLVQLANYMHNSRGRRLRSFKDAKPLAIADARERYGQKKTNPETTDD